MTASLQLLGEEASDRRRDQNLCCLSRRRVHKFQRRRTVSKFHWRFNNYDYPGEKAKAREAVVTEVADVLVMIEQVKLMAEIDDDELSEEITRKVERLDDRLRVYED